MNRVEFNEIIELLRSDDSMLYEDGYQSLTRRVDEVLDWLIDLEANEKTEKMKAKLIELIGESTEPRAIDVLKISLSSDFYEVRLWAYSALNYSELPECNQLAEEYKSNNPNEEFL